MWSCGQNLALLSDSFVLIPVSFVHVYNESMVTCYLRLVLSKATSAIGPMGFLEK